MLHQQGRTFAYRAGPVFADLLQEILVAKNRVRFFRGMKIRKKLWLARHRSYLILPAGASDELVPLRQQQPVLAARGVAAGARPQAQRQQLRAIAATD